MGKNLETVGKTLFWTCLFGGFVSNALCWMNMTGRMTLLLTIQGAILYSAALIGYALEIAGHSIAKRKEGLFGEE